MVRQEINEIKKLFNYSNCSITRICGCYVNGEKQINQRWQQSFLSMDDEDLFKYMEIFRKCLSGGLEKNLINIHINSKDVVENWTALRDSKLKNEELLESFYERIIETYPYVGNYLILVIHDVYDVPGKTKDNMEMEDASDTVYEYIMACICPVNLSKPGLGYDKEKGKFTHVERDWILSVPEVAVLYPAFNDRAEDTNAALFYARSMDIPEKEFAEMILGYDVRLNHSEERVAFDAITEETLGVAKLEEIKEIQQVLISMVEENKDRPEPMKVDLAAVEKIFSSAGIDNDKMKRLPNAYYSNMGKDHTLTLNNIVNMKSLTIETDAGRVIVKPEYADEVSIREIDGNSCLVLNIFGRVKANGVEVSGESEPKK